jgi:hypothetical protein
MPPDLDAPDKPIYRDTQRLPLWVYGVLVAIVGLLGYLATTLPRPGSIVLAFAAGLVLLQGLIIAINFSRMMTEVTATEVRGRFGLYRFAIPLQRIARVEVVEVNPWAVENWGVRGAVVKGGFVGLRGRRGVRLCLGDGKDLVLGSNRAEDLVEAIRSRIGRPSQEAPSV